MATSNAPKCINVTRQTNNGTVLHVCYIPKWNIAYIGFGNLTSPSTVYQHNLQM